MTIVLAGGIGRSGLGGQAWAYLQYLIGFRELGHDVYYLEDCGETSNVWNWDAEEWTQEITFPANYVRQCLEPFGFKGKWIYRTNTESEGMAIKDFEAICSQADVLIMRAIPLWDWRKEFDAVRRRIFIDVDPGFTQMNIAGGDKGFAAAISRCEKFFSYGQNIGAPDTKIPNAGYNWLRTVPPVALSHWPFVERPATHFTAIMRWDGFQNAEYKGVTYGQKDLEFPKYLELPKKTGQKFRIAINGPELRVEYGWESIPGEIATRTPFSYQEFIQQSMAEFGVAKHGYVQMRSGWFSDRSVCYLASGRPVVVQDTGLNDDIPLGQGMVTFSDFPGACDAITNISSNYQKHRLAARKLAENHFATDKVLPALLDAAMT
jgi:hypothetical protein